MDIYRERAHLVSFLSKIFPSTIGYTDPAEPDWAVVAIDTPQGQLTWHVSPGDMDLFEHVERYDAEWDGHSTEEKYDRLSRLA